MVKPRLKREETSRVSNNPELSQRQVRARTTAPAAAAWARTAPRGPQPKGLSLTAAQPVPALRRHAPCVRQCDEHDTRHPCAQPHPPPRSGRAANRILSRGRSQCGRRRTVEEKKRGEVATTWQRPRTPVPPGRRRALTRLASRPSARARGRALRRARRQGTPAPSHRPGARLHTLATAGTPPVPHAC
jgi:hypothetical protein